MRLISQSADLCVAANRGFTDRPSRQNPLGSSSSQLDGPNPGLCGLQTRDETGCIAG